MYKCIECGYEFDPSESDTCPLCGGGRDMEVSYVDSFSIPEVVVCEVCNTAFNSLIGSKVCMTCAEDSLGLPCDGEDDGFNGLKAALERVQTHKREGVYKLLSCDVGHWLYVIINRVTHLVASGDDVDEEALDGMDVLFEAYEKLNQGEEATATYYRGTYPLSSIAHKAVEGAIKPW